MSLLDPNELFERIARDIPSELHPNLFITGSLAAAYHFRGMLENHAVNTKDADVVVHPAGNVSTTQDMALRLLDSGWWRDPEECYPQPAPEPEDALRAIRLYPRDSRQYFIEFLNIPLQEQAASKKWLPIELAGGWYGLPSFRFMGLTAIDRRKSHVNLEYAAPATMALSNLLSHPTVGNERMLSGPFRGLLRSAKDLGRVLALAWLAERKETEAWFPVWEMGLRQCFPTEGGQLAQRVGQGLRELLGDATALEEARQTTEAGLLNGKNVSADNLHATGNRLFADLIEPFEKNAAASWANKEPSTPITGQ